MHPFQAQYAQDLQVIIDLQGALRPEDLPRIRSRIDRMTSQNLRQVALEIFREKEKTSSR